MRREFGFLLPSPSAIYMQHETDRNPPLNEKDKQQASAAEKMQQAIQQMRQAFIHELIERCDEIENLILNADWQSGVSEEIYRVVHSLKGTAAMYSLPLISTICHQLEDQLNDPLSLKQADELVEFALQCVDLIRQVQTRLHNQEQDFSSIEQQLHNLKQVQLGDRKAVLIVESTAFMKGLYFDALKSLPVEISLMDDGLAALTRLLTERFDILIVGRQLKGLNGVALLKALAASESVNNKITSCMVSSGQEEHIADYHVAKSTHLADDIQQIVASLIP